MNGCTERGEGQEGMHRMNSVNGQPTPVGAAANGINSVKRQTVEQETV